MGNWNRRRLLAIIAGLIAVSLASTSVAQVTISNTYSISAHPMTPQVMLATGNLSQTGTNVSVNSYGTHYYGNITEIFELNSRTTVNLTDVFNISSSSGVGYGYLSNVTVFNGQNDVASVGLYSLSANGSFASEFNYSGNSGYSNSTVPVLLPAGSGNSFGLVVTVGYNALYTLYTWNLDFTINGYYYAHDGTPPVYTQYSANLTVTTFEG